MADQLSEKAEKMLKERDKLAAAIQNDVTALAMKLNKFTDQNLELYNMLSAPDCLYNDSPLSDFQTYRWLKEFMIKKDLDFVGYVLDGKVTIKNFTERMSEVNGWVMRFAKEKEKQKTGLEAIV